MKPFYITTAIAYPNGDPHIGHSYEAVVTDAIARFHRLTGKEVFFQTGTDEHGQKMLRTSIELGLTPKETADIGSNKFRKLYDVLNISYDNFIRTTDLDHIKSAQALWRAIDLSGDIYKDVYRGWYSVKDERYFDESETTLVESGGERVSNETGNIVEWLEEESYFFKLSKYQDQILKILESQPSLIYPERAYNEVLAVVRSGLTDLSISRTKFNWGVPVPGDPSHVQYVWIDALANYLTGAGYPDKKFDKIWPANIHIIGKDITRFHAIYWIAFLLSANIELPSKIVSHGFLLKNGVKASKSLGGNDSVFDLVDRFGADGFRYFLLKDIPLNRDSAYNNQAILETINADLANNIGNLVNRILGQVHKKHSGFIPFGVWGSVDQKLWDDSLTLSKLIEDDIQNLKINEALTKISSYASEANKYVQEQAPWSANDTRRAEILNVICNVIKNIAILLSWATPDFSNQILKLLGVSNDRRSFADVTELLDIENKLPDLEIAFPRVI